MASLSAHRQALGALGVRATWLPRCRARCVVVRAEAVPTAVRTKQLWLRIGAKCIPHPDKVSYGGEDAHFVSSIGGGALGVADGVGGWQESGVNPADYSRTFMEMARRYLEGDSLPDVVPSPSAASSNGSAVALASGEWMDGKQQWNPVGSSGDSLGMNDAAAFKQADALLAEEAQQQQQPSASQPEQPSQPRTALGALEAAHAITRFPGSATACVLRLDAESATLDTANLGDSGFLIIREGRMVFQSQPLQHYFDCPLQFGIPPDTDYASDGDVLSLPLAPGDVVVLGTDGLLDNCYSEELVGLAPKAAEDVEQAAAAMAELASAHARDPEFESPYTQEALEEGMDIPIWEKLLKTSFKDGRLEVGKLRGGKLDDITVLVAVVCERESVPEGQPA